MASHHAHLACVLELNPHCDACVRHTMEVIYSCDGVYDVEYDAERKTARIMGEVDPNFCLKALARCGYHASLKHVKLTHPRLSSTMGGSYDHPYGSYGHNYPRLGPSYHDHAHYAPNTRGYGGDPYRRSLPEGMWHDYPTRSASLPYNAVPYYGGSTSYYDRPYGRDAYDYTPYGSDHGMGRCTIM